MAGQPRRDLLAPHPDPRTERYIARLIDQAPPLTGAHRDRIVRILRNAESGRAERAQTGTPGEARPAA